MKLYLIAILVASLGAGLAQGATLKCGVINNNAFYPSEFENAEKLGAISFSDADLPFTWEGRFNGIMIDRTKDVYDGDNLDRIVNRNTPSILQTTTAAPVFLEYKFTFTNTEITENGLVFNVSSDPLDSFLKVVDQDGNPISVHATGIFHNPQYIRSGAGRVHASQVNNFTSNIGTMFYDRSAINGTLKFVRDNAMQSILDFNLGRIAPTCYRSE